MQLLNQTLAESRHCVFPDGEQEPVRQAARRLHDRGVGAVRLGGHVPGALLQAGLDGRQVLQGGPVVHLAQVPHGHHVGAHHRGGHPHLPRTTGTEYTEECDYKSIAFFIFKILTIHELIFRQLF